jgi:ribosomal protein S18 acetylase RimI-like enzyme
MTAEVTKIRNAKKEDFNFIYESLKLIYTDLDKIGFLKRINIIQKKKKSWILVAENELNHIIGFIISQNIHYIDFQHESIIISDFYIEPKYRKLKLADKLFQEVEERAIKNDFNQIIVMCNITATTTQNFYTKHKFKFIKKAYIKQI